MVEKTIVAQEIPVVQAEAVEEILRLLEVLEQQVRDLMVDQE